MLAPDACLVGVRSTHLEADSGKLVTAEEIQATYPFKNLPPDWMGLYAPDNGIINVQLLLRTVFSLAKDYGAEAKQHTQVNKIVPSEDDNSIWEVQAIHHGNPDVNVTFKAKKVVIASGAYINQVLTPSFGISLDLDIWEMVACYFNVNAGPKGTIFPSKLGLGLLVYFCGSRVMYFLTSYEQACGSSSPPT